MICGLRRIYQTTVEIIVSYTVLTFKIFIKLVQQVSKKVGIVGSDLIDCIGNFSAVMPCK